MTTPNITITIGDQLLDPKFFFLLLQAGAFITGRVELATSDDDPTPIDGQLSIYNQSEEGQLISINRSGPIKISEVARINVTAIKVGGHNFVPYMGSRFGNQHYSPVHLNWSELFALTLLLEFQLYEPLTHPPSSFLYLETDITPIMILSGESNKMPVLKYQGQKWTFQSLEDETSYKALNLAIKGFAFRTVDGFIYMCPDTYLNP